MMCVSKYTFHPENSFVVAIRNMLMCTCRRKFSEDRPEYRLVEIGLYIPPPPPRMRKTTHRHISLYLKTLFRERSFLKLGTGVEEFLEGCQIILPRLIGV